MAYDGHIRFKTKIDNSRVEKELKKIESQIKQSQDSVSKAQTAKMPLVKQMESLNAELDEASAKLKKLQAEQAYASKVLSNDNDPESFDPEYYVDPEKFIEISSNKGALDAAVLEQQKHVDALQRQWDDASAAVEKYDQKIHEANISIEQNTAKAENLRSKLKPNADKMSQAFAHMQNTATRFGGRILEIAKSAFIFNIISSGLRAVASHMGNVLKTNSEYVSQLAQLKGTLLTAFQPIYDFILPGLLAIQEALLTIVRVAATAISALFGKTVSQSAANAKALNKQAAAISGVGNAAEDAEKQLMGFDEINKLNAANAGGGGSGGIGPDFNGISTDQYNETINRLIAPLKEIDFTMLQASLTGLGESFANLGAIITDSLEWAWFNILVPLGEWQIEEAAPAVVDTLASALDMLSEVLGPVVDGFKLFWKWIQPVVEFVQETVILVFEKFKESFDKLAQVFRENGPQITGIISGIGETIALLWELIRPTMENLRNLWGTVFSKIVDVAVGTIDKLIDVFSGLIEFVNGVLTHDWDRAWEGLKTMVSSAVDGIISIIFGLNNIVADIIDGILQAIRDVVYAINSWFGGGISVSTSTNTSNSGGLARTIDAVPAMASYQVPMLARGAVIPPNAPFLAMLGDQRNGTNIEAPLDTIEQALRNVIREQGSGDIKIEFTGDLAQLGRILQPVVHRAERNAARAGGW